MKHWRWVLVVAALAALCLGHVTYGLLPAYIPLLLWAAQVHITPDRYNLDAELAYILGEHK